MIQKIPNKGDETVETVKSFSKPGLFSLSAAADNRRTEFDLKNQVLIQRELPVDTVFFGDSITQFWELNAYFGGSGKLIVNRGIGGDETEFAARRFYADVVQLRPRRCVMLLGVNDSWKLEYDGWLRREGWTVSQVLARAEENFRTIASLAKTHGLDLIVCSVLPTDMDFTNREDLRKEYIGEVNGFLWALCREEGFLYVDYFSATVGEDGRSIRAGLTLEGLHPNVFGYDIMARVLRETLAGRGVEL